jgi:hypothetical protein
MNFNTGVFHESGQNDLRFAERKEMWCLDKLGCHPLLANPFLLHKLFWEPIVPHPPGQRRLHNVLAFHR